MFVVFIVLFIVCPQTELIFIQECPRHSCCEMHAMQHMAYSSVHLCNVAGDYITHLIKMILLL